MSISHGGVGEEDPEVECAEGEGDDQEAGHGRRGSHHPLQGMDVDVLDGHRSIGLVVNPVDPRVDRLVEVHPPVEEVEAGVVDQGDGEEL